MSRILGAVQVKEIDVMTIGGIVPQNGKLMTIVPLDEQLLIEARISPRDIAFIHSGQEALVKITAYDYSIYGGLKGKVTIISPDTLRDGIHLQEAIQTAKEIEQQSKKAGFNQIALDQMAQQCFSNAKFEVNSEEGLDLVEEFYAVASSEAEQQPIDLKEKTKPKLNQDDGFVQDMKKGLQQSVSTVN